MYPEHLKYTENHEWLRDDGERVGEIQEVTNV